MWADSCGKVSLPTTRPVISGVAAPVILSLLTLVLSFALLEDTVPIEGVAFVSFAVEVSHASAAQEAPEARNPYRSPAIKVVR